MPVVRMPFGAYAFQWPAGGKTYGQAPWNSPPFFTAPPVVPPVVVPDVPGAHAAAINPIDASVESRRKRRRLAV
jgi:hypothetical protein